MDETELTKQEQSMLLYAETCAVDYGGGLSSAHMNLEDQQILKKWHISGFVHCGRIKFQHIGRSGRTKQVKLSEEAWVAVALLRKSKAERSYHKDMETGG